MSNYENELALSEIREAVRSLQNQNLSDNAIAIALLQTSKEVAEVKNTGKSYVLNDKS